MIHDADNLLFIVNKYSGTGFNPAMESMVRGCCARHRVHCAVEYTQGPGHATTLAHQAIADGCRRIIAVGGDGTVNEVARAVANSPAAMGIIPKGSGNGLARHLGISMRFEDAVNSLFTHEEVAIDTFYLNGKLSLNVSGIGFDGYVAERFGTDKQRGFQGYMKLVLNEFRSFEEFEAEITVGGYTLRKKAFVIAIANSSQYGNNARIAPLASVRDRLLDIAVLRKAPPYRLDFIYSLFTGTIDQSAYCETLQTQSATIRLPFEMFYHVDGEPAGKADHFTVELKPASLRMLTPYQGTF